MYLNDIFILRSNEMNSKITEVNVFVGIQIQKQVPETLTVIGPRMFTWAESTDRRMQVVKS